MERALIISKSTLESGDVWAINTMRKVIRAVEAIIGHYAHKCPESRPRLSRYTLITVN